MTETLTSRIAASLDRPVRSEVRAFAEMLAKGSGASAILFYGSNLRTGSLEGVLDFYILLPGPQRERIWPRVSYREWDHDGVTLRAKIATMSMERFAAAASGASRDTTIWARFVQPAALVWCAGNDEREAIRDALKAAAITAARLAAAVGPTSGTADEYWRALFRATYKAEFRVEKPGRENAILEVNADHFDGLLPLAWDAAGARTSVFAAGKPAGSTTFAEPATFEGDGHTSPSAGPSAADPVVAVNDAPVRTARANPAIFKSAPSNRAAARSFPVKSSAIRD